MHTQNTVLSAQIDSSKPLVGQATIRGAYTNTGSKDAGPDPDAAKYHGGKSELSAT